MFAVDNNAMAAIDGKKRFSMDKLMTVLCFILLFIVVIIPIFMIIYNAFFDQNGFSLNLILEQFADKKNLDAMFNTVKIAVFATIFGTLPISNGCLIPLKSIILSFVNSGSVA